MSYVNDAKPSGSYTGDKVNSLVAWDDTAAAWDSSFGRWDGIQTYSNDLKPAGAYSNDAKPT